MVSYEEAYEIAKTKENAPVISASELPAGWVFGYEQKHDADRTIIPGGPHPTVVFKDGHVQRVLIPLPEAFDLMDSITERDLPLPE